MSGNVPPTAVRLVRLAARLVPAYRRVSWLRQWSAELEHLCRQHDSASKAVRFAWGSLPHALSLRFQEISVEGIVLDARHAFRGMRAQPGFAALAATTLAIGIGATTAVFSLAESLVLRPLPLPEQDRLVRMFSANPDRGMASFSVSYPDFVDLAERSALFESASLYVESERDISGGGDPQRVRTTHVHEAYFQTLGSRLLLGRAFVADDHAPAGTPTVLLDQDFWVGRFGADSTVLGRDVRIDGVLHTVIGVVERGQGWPAGADVWMPLRWGGVAPDWADVRSNHTWQVVARLAGDVSVGDASTRVREQARAIYAAADIDERDVGTEAYLMGLRASAGGESPGPIFATLGTAVFLVLLIACMNASGLLLTRAGVRARELSVRAALGAGRARLVVTLMSESLLLALLGGAMGLWLGHVALRRGLEAAPPEVQSAADPELNAAVVTAALAASVLAALLAGVAPALRSTRRDLAGALREAAGQAGDTRTVSRLRQGLIVGEVALSLALLFAAGITVRGFQRQVATDPGFDAERLVSFSVRLPQSRYGDDASVEDFYRRAVAALERDPRIESATATSVLPLGGVGVSLYRSFIFDGAPPPPEGAEFGAQWVEIDPGYFATLGITPVEGRDIGEGDDADAPLIALVNRTMARAMSPTESIVGREIRSFYDENLPRTVVGVIDDIQFGGVSRANRRPIVFVPRAQAVRTEMAFLARTTEDPGEMLGTVRTIMSELEGDVALDQLQSLRDAHAADLAGIRFLTSLFGAFGLLAMVLTVSGVYGLVSYSVTRRTKELGLRMALGATAGVVRRRLVRESAVLAGLGLFIGSGLAYVAGRVLAAGMSGVAEADLPGFLGVCALLAGAVLAASWVPASRVARVDPVESLRAE